MKTFEITTTYFTSVDEEDLQCWFGISDELWDTYSDGDKLQIAENYAYDDDDTFEYSTVIEVIEN